LARTLIDDTQIQTQGGLTPGTYGDATHVGAFTVNAEGIVTAASSVAVTGTTQKRRWSYVLGGWTPAATGRDFNTLMVLPPGPDGAMIYWKPTAATLYIGGTNGAAGVEVDYTAAIGSTWVQLCTISTSGATGSYNGQTTSFASGPNSNTTFQTGYFLSCNVTAAAGTDWLLVVDFQES
jgi:hypothetical protein